ncbi:MAG: methylmalonyl-CoA epimerase [Trueperaceae bacterium]|nr:methylmalonyl-CoA epimerase [Trueperaceae bacterium]
MTWPDELPAGVAGLPIDHVGIAVRDLDEGAAPWSQLGLPALDDETVPEQGVRVRLLRAGDAAIELLAPLDDTSQLARFLERRGPGVHHVAFRVDDVDAELARLLAEGARAVDLAPRPGRAGSRVAFLHPSWAGGVLVELVQPAAPEPPSR